MDKEKYYKNSDESVLEFQLDLKTGLNDKNLPISKDGENRNNCNNSWDSYKMLLFLIRLIFNLGGYEEQNDDRKRETE